MNKIHISHHKTKIGELVVGSFEGKICLLDFAYRRMRKTVDERIKKLLQAEFVEQEDEIISKAKIQIDEYLSGERADFDFPILLVGSDFQKQVWEALQKIPYGQTASYKDLANMIENPKAVRAVANANGANALALVVPCHRIIESNGELGGYGGGLPIKKRLLKMEGENTKKLF